MMIDPVYRLDLYGLSSKLSQRHWAHLVQEHFSDHPDVVAKAKAALTAEESAVVQAALEMFNTSGRGNDSPMGSSSTSHSMEC